MTHKCKGVLRSPKGDRLLVAIATDRNNKELQDTIKLLRERAPCYRALSDDELMEEIETMIAKLPKKCPECAGQSD